MTEREWKLGKDVFEEDNALDGITFDEIITTLVCNVKTFDEKAVKKVACEILEYRLDDYRHLLEKNIDEIITRAKKRRYGGND